MSTPRYVTVRIGDNYYFRRVDEDFKFQSTCATVGGAALAAIGFSSRSLVGLGVGAAGVGLIYYGLTGRNPIADLRGCRTQESEHGPSFQHDGTSDVKQSPRDDIDEAAMESFPASDPPALGKQP